MRVAQFEQFRRQAVDLVSEQNADRKSSPPVEDVHGLIAGFDSGNLITLASQVSNASKPDHRRSATEHVLLPREPFC